MKKRLLLFLFLFFVPLAGMRHNFNPAEEALLAEIRGGPVYRQKCGDLDFAEHLQQQETEQYRQAMKSWSLKNFIANNKISVTILVTSFIALALFFRFLSTRQPQKVKRARLKSRGFAFLRIIDSY